MSLVSQDYFEEIQVTDVMNRSKTNWQKVCLAARAAKRVHKMIETSEDAILFPGSSFFGFSKAFCVVEEVHDGARCIVIAIRGSRTTICDWMANLNSAPAALTEIDGGIQCHQGFLALSRNMNGYIEKAIKKYTCEQHPIEERRSLLAQPTNIIFTGHSSGAAVAQLIFSTMFRSWGIGLGE